MFASSSVDRRFGPDEHVVWQDWAALWRSTAHPIRSVYDLFLDAGGRIDSRQFTAAAFRQLCRRFYSSLFPLVSAVVADGDTAGAARIYNEAVQAKRIDRRLFRSLHVWTAPDADSVIEGISSCRNQSPTAFDALEVAIADLARSAGEKLFFAGARVEGMNGWARVLTVDGGMPSPIVRGWHLDIIEQHPGQIRLAPCLIWNDSTFLCAKPSVRLAESLLRGDGAESQTQLNTCCKLVADTYLALLQTYIDRSDLAARAKSYYPFLARAGVRLSALSVPVAWLRASVIPAFNYLDLGKAVIDRGRTGSWREELATSLFALVLLDFKSH